MSVETKVFHTYGFLVTDEIVSIMLKNAISYWKRQDIELYSRFKGQTDTEDFKEYMCSNHQMSMFGNTQDRSVFRIIDNMEMDIDLEDYFCIINLKKVPGLFIRAYHTIDEVKEEIKRNIGNFLEPNFYYYEYLLEIYGTIWC